MLFERSVWTSSYICKNIFNLCSLVIRCLLKMSVFKSFVLLIFSLFIDEFIHRQFHSVRCSDLYFLSNFHFKNIGEHLYKILFEYVGVLDFTSNRLGENRRRGVAEARWRVR